MSNLEQQQPNKRVVDNSLYYSSTTLVFPKDDNEPNQQAPQQQTRTRTPTNPEILRQQQLRRQVHNHSGFPFHLLEHRQYRPRFVPSLPPIQEVDEPNDDENSQESQESEKPKKPKKPKKSKNRDHLQHHFHYRIAVKIRCLVYLVLFVAFLVALCTVAALYFGGKCHTGSPNQCDCENRNVNDEPFKNHSNNNHPAGVHFVPGSVQAVLEYGFDSTRLWLRRQSHNSDSLESLDSVSEDDVEWQLEPSVGSDDSEAMAMGQQACLGVEAFAMRYMRYRELTDKWSGNGFVVDLDCFPDEYQPPRQVLRALNTAEPNSALGWCVKPTTTRTTTSGGGGGGDNEDFNYDHFFLGSGNYTDCRGQLTAMLNLTTCMMDRMFHNCPVLMVGDGLSSGATVPSTSAPLVLVVVEPALLRWFRVAHIAVVTPATTSEDDGQDQLFRLDRTRLVDSTRAICLAKKNRELAEKKVYRQSGQSSSSESQGNTLCFEGVLLDVMLTSLVGSQQDQPSVQNSNDSSDSSVWVMMAAKQKQAIVREHQDLPATTATTGTPLVECSVLWTLVWVSFVGMLLMAGVFGLDLIILWIYW